MIGLATDSEKGVSVEEKIGKNTEAETRICMDGLEEDSGGLDLHLQTADSMACSARR